MHRKGNTLAQSRLSSLTAPRRPPDHFAAANEHFRRCPRIPYQTTVARCRGDHAIPVSSGRVLRPGTKPEQFRREIRALILASVTVCSALNCRNGTLGEVMLSVASTLPKTPYFGRISNRAAAGSATLLPRQISLACELRHCHSFRSLVGLIKPTRLASSDGATVFVPRLGWYSAVREAQKRRQMDGRIAGPDPMDRRVLRQNPVSTWLADVCDSAQGLQRG